MTEMIERVMKAIMAEENPDSYNQYENMARAAIEAMREPTDRMCAVANGIHFPDKVWRSMIQEALEED